MELTAELANAALETKHLLLSPPASSLTLEVLSATREGPGALMVHRNAAPYPATPHMIEVVVDEVSRKEERYKGGWL